MQYSWMNKFFTLLALLFVFCSAQALSITELKAEPSTVIEGQAVFFEAVLDDALPEGAVFEWDFNDGSTGFSGCGKTAHSFFNQSLKETEKFVVSVKLINSGVMISEESVLVGVGSVDFKPFLNEEFQLPGNELKKTVPFEVSLRLLFKFGQSGNIVLNDLNSLEFVSFSGVTYPLEIETEINGKKVSLLTYSGEISPKTGSLVGVIEPDSSFSCIELLKVKATLADSEKMSFSIPLFFEQAVIESDNPFNEELFPGSKLGLKKFNLVVGNSLVPTDGNFFADVLSGSDLKESKELFFSDGKWIAEFDYVVSSSDSRKGLVVVLRGLDEFGNVLNKRFELNAKEFNPLFRAELVSPSSDFLGFGQEAVFVVRVDPDNLLLLESPSFRIKNEAMGVNELMVQENEFFTTKLKMPSRGAKNQVFEILGEAVIGGKKTLLPISKKLELSDTLSVKFRILYPNNESYHSESIQALLSLDGIKSEIELVYLHDLNLFVASVSELSPGKHSLSVKLLDGLNGFASVETELSEELDLTLVIGVVLVVILGGFGVYVFRSSLKSRKYELIAAKGRLIEIDRALKKAKVEYFKRKITDSAYRGRVLKLEQEKEQLKKKLKGKN